MARRQRRHFSDEFKQRAVELVRSTDRSISVICAELDISETALRRWMIQADNAEAQPEIASHLTASERDELRRLRYENKVLREEREILKKPRPSSPTRPGSGEHLPLHRSREGPLLDHPPLLGAWGQPLRLLRLGGPRALGARRRGSAPDRADPPDPRRLTRHLWRPAHPGRACRRPSDPHRHQAGGSVDARRGPLWSTPPPLSLTRRRAPRAPPGS